MPSGGYFEVEPGVDLYYEDRGQGTPIVFVPGWTFTTDVFQHQYEDFAATHRVISFDPRSQGRSTVVVQGNDYETQSTDLARLMDHLSVERPIIVAWSNASLTAWGFVRLRGTHALRGIATIDLPPAPLTGRPADWNEFSMEDAASFYQSLLTPRGHREVVTSYALGTMVERDLSPEELDWIVGQSTRTPCWAAAAYSASGWFSDYLPEAKLVDAELKALMFVANVSAGAAIPYLERHLPNTEVEQFGGHFMFWEHHEEFNAVLRKYVESLD